MFVKPESGYGYWADWNDIEVRSPLGLGWEYRRHKRSKAENPFDRETQFEQWKEFMEGFDSFKCKNASINKNYGYPDGLVLKSTP